MEIKGVMGTGSVPASQKTDLQPQNNDYQIQFSAGMSEEEKSIRIDVKNSFDRYIRQLSFNWNLMDPNCIELHLDKNNKLSYGDIKAMFHIRDYALTDAANPSMEPHFHLDDGDVPQDTVQIPISSIGYGGIKPMTYDETMTMYKQAKEKYEKNKKQALTFIKDNAQNFNIIYNENKGNENGPYIQIHGDGKTTMGEYKQSLALKDGVIKRDNPNFHAPNLNNLVVEPNEFFRVYTKDLGEVGIENKYVKKAVK
ncbi:MAG: hypothetical protein LBK53_09940 [Heliobacteriaceae bacterium]|jgi:hypothetical protein|nr:hypothetical protein [Heliobacteriaceae bacterium]